MGRIFMPFTDDFSHVRHIVTLSHCHNKGVAMCTGHSPLFVTSSHCHIVTIRGCDVHGSGFMHIYLNSCIIIIFNIYIKY